MSPTHVCIEAGSVPELPAAHARVVVIALAVIAYGHFLGNGPTSTFAALTHNNDIHSRTTCCNP
jgi:hypothetical protein